MKIAFIGQKRIPSDTDGTEKDVESLALELAKRNHEVFVYVGSDFDGKKYKEINLIQVSGFSALATIHALFQNYDVLHYHTAGSATLSFLIKIFRPKIALFFTFHRRDPFHQLSEYIICKIANKTIAVSRVLEKFIKEKFNQSAKVIPSGISVFPTSEDYLLEDWGLCKNEYILAVGRPEKLSGIHNLLSAYNNLEEKKKTNGKKLVIVNREFYSGDYADHLYTIAIENKNTIFVGTQTGEALKQLFSNAYMFVQPSDSEGFSISLLEAMAFGRAVLASDISENMEPLGNNGFYFLKGNAKDLEEKLLKLINNPKSVKKTGKSVREVADQDYQWEKIAEKTENLYRDILFKKFDNKLIFHNSYGKDAKI